MKDISKIIQKRMRDIKRRKRHGNVEILEQFKRVKTIASIKTRKKKVLISLMRNDAGEIEASREGIANTFAKLLRGSVLSKEHESEGADVGGRSTTPFTDYPKGASGRERAAGEDHSQGG